MNILFLRGFNNYFNRVIKKYTGLNEYRSNSTSYVNFESINFNPNDGVATELILGNESQKENNLPLDWENIGTPDYCVCYENSDENEEGYTIVSRWFVLESERLRTGQYRLALKRDVVAEHFDTIKVSPCFIEKGMVNDVDDPLLYNKESMTYNQIKTSEIPLKDATGCGWIVGYIPKNVPSSEAVSSRPTISTKVLLEGTPSEYITSDEVPGLTDILGPGDNKIYRETLDSIISIHIPTIYNYGVNNTSGTISTYKTFNYTTFQIKSDATIAEMDNFTTNSMAPQAAYQSGNTTSNISSEAALLHSKTGNFYGYSQLFRLKPVYTSSANAMAYDATTISTPGSGTNTHESVLKSSSSNINTMNNHKSSYSAAHSLLKTYISNTMSSYNICEYSYDEEISTIFDLDGKVIKLPDNKYYYITVNTLASELFVFSNSSSISSVSVDNVSSVLSGLTTHYINTGATTANPLSSALISTWKSYVNGNINYYGNNGSSLFSKLYYTYNVVLSQISTETLMVSNRVYTDRNHTYDNSADIFAVPYGAMAYKTTSDGATKYTAYNRGLAIARAIASAMGDNGCYDLQIVPYCPSAIISDYLKSYGYLPTFNIDSQALQYVYSGSIASGNECGFVLWCSQSKGSFDIELSLTPSINYQGVLSNPLLYKISNETELVRLASPNYNGQFEFSLAKNHGVTKFNVDYTYKPFAPYIHVNPNFKELYGEDWDDARGLICGGDFSLNHITSYWQTYINNNKNFQQIFDRQIQNMDVNNSIAIEKQQFQATVGAVTSAIGGAMGGAAAGAGAGMMTGNPFIAAGGAILGGIGGGIGSYAASSYGAEKDMEWLKRQQAEARSFAIDMYGYQLGNIQAMPYSLRGSECLTNNNKIWPIVEIYEPTSNEVEILKSKIEFNGMTIMAIDQIRYYMTSLDFDKVFIKGQLIRLESDDINDDFHIADAIYQEINKGVYIPSGGL